MMASATVLTASPPLSVPASAPPPPPPSSSSSGAAEVPIALAAVHHALSSASTAFPTAATTPDSTTDLLAAAQIQAVPAPLSPPMDTATKRLSASSTSALSHRSRATSGTSGRTRVGSNPLTTTISTSTSTLASSSGRPSSVASTSSQSSTERSAGTHVLLSPTMLSPPLASNLVAGRSGLSHKRSAGVGPAAGGMTGRRISLPNVPSMVNRVSMISVASFESLPERGEDEAQAAQLQHSPTLSDSSSSALSPRTDLKRFPALPPSPRLRSSFSIIEASPTSPELPRAAALLPARHLRPKSSLKRSSTEPYGMGKEFEMLMSKRRFVAMELLQTERAYMQSLKLLDENFLKPMQAASQGQPPPSKTNAPCPAITRKVVAEIFGNFTNIYTLNKELLSQLEQRLGPQERILTSTTPGRPSSVASADSTSTSGELIMASSAAMSVSASATSSHMGSASSRSTLHEWNPREDLIGDILVPIAPFLSMYKLFAQHFSNSLARIEAERKRDEAFNRFIKAAERAAWSNGPSQAGFGLGFEAHLLTIVQRITRYKMLVGDLVKFTPDGHPDRAELVKAHNLISQIAHDCDDNIRTHEMVLLMLNIQRSLTGLTEPLVVPGRSLLKRGALLKTCRKNIQPREFFLFSDCIVYAAPTGGGMESSASAAWQAMVGSSLASVLGSEWASSPSLSGASKRGGAVSSSAAVAALGVRVRTNSASSLGGSGSTSGAGAVVAPLSLQSHTLQYRAKIALQDCTVVSVELAHPGTLASVPDNLRHSFELRTPEKSFALYAESQASKEDWMTRIREAKEAHMIARRTLRAEEDSIEAKRERRRSLYRDQKSLASAVHARSALRLSMPLGNGSASNIATVREGEPFPSSETDTSLAESPVHGEPLSPMSVPNSSTELHPGRERQRLNSLQSLTAALPTASLGGLLSPSMGAPAGKPLKVVEDYNAPVWVPDNQADKCAVCSDGFGLWRRKHHCRLCGQVVCWNCSQRSFLIPAYQEGAEDQQARACDRCFDSMFPPSEDEASPSETTLPLPPEDAVADTSDEANQTARAEPMPVMSTPTSRGARGGAGARPVGVRVDSDASPASPATPADGPPLLMRKGRLVAGPDAVAVAVAVAGAGADSATSVPDLVVDSSADALSVPFSHLGLTTATATTSTPAPAPSSDLGELYAHAPEALRQLVADGRAPGPASPRLYDPMAGQGRLGMGKAQVTAATSGAGTFRLVTPRMTTPEWEAPPVLALGQEGGGARVLPAGLAGGGGGGGGTAAGDVSTASIPSAASTTRRSMDVGASGPRPASLDEHRDRDYFAGATPRRRKKVFSAAARLSSFYGQATAGAGSLAKMAAASATTAAAAGAAAGASASGQSGGVLAKQA